MTGENRALTFTIFCMVVLIIVLVLAWPTHARDLGQWENSDPAIRKWYETLMMPDNPSVRCCGKDDEYRCEAFVRNGETWCRVNDDRVNPRRPPVAIGTEIHIPRHKYKFDQGNPTGHTVVFGRPSSVDFYVYCFVQGTGI